jgi:hypothetical protein
MRNKNTIDAVLLLDYIQKQNRNRYPCITFLDVKSAYDSVNRSKLCNELLVTVNNEYTRSIISVFEKLFRNEESELFEL